MSNDISNLFQHVYNINNYERYNNCFLNEVRKFCKDNTSDEEGEKLYWKFILESKNISKFDKYITRKEKEELNIILEYGRTHKNLSLDVDDDIDII